MELILAIAAWLKQDGTAILQAPFTFGIAVVAVLYFARMFYRSKIKELEDQHAAYKADQKTLVDGIVLTKDAALDLERSRNEFLTYQVVELKSQIVLVARQKTAVYPTQGLPMGKPSLTEEPGPVLENFEAPALSRPRPGPVFSRAGPTVSWVNEDTNKKTESGLISIYTFPARVQAAAKQLADKPVVLRGAGETWDGDTVRSYAAFSVLKSQGLANIETLTTGTSVTATNSLSNLRKEIEALKPADPDNLRDYDGRPYQVGED